MRRLFSMSTGYNKDSIHNGYLASDIRTCFTPSTSNNDHNIDDLTLNHKSSFSSILILYFKSKFDFSSVYKYFLSDLVLLFKLYSNHWQCYAF